MGIRHVITRVNEDSESLAKPEDKVSEANVFQFLAALETHVAETNLAARNQKGVFA